MAKKKPARRFDVALIGFGGVGSSVYDLLREQREPLLRDTGCELEISHVFDPDGEKTAALPRDIVRGRLEEITVADLAVITSSGVKSSLANILYFLERQCPVVTSSTTAMLFHRARIYQAAEASGVDVYFEATVGGGIPIVELIRRGLASLGIDEIYGIVHASTNYILSSMTDSLKDAHESAAEAAGKGISQTETRESVEGMGTAVKMLILAGLAFDGWVDINRVENRGIGDVSISDIAYAGEMGFQIRHMGIVKRHESGIMIASEPMLISNDSSLAGTREDKNVIVVKGPHIGELVFQGRGAGGAATAVSVVCDVIEAVRNLSQGIKKRYSYRFRPETAVKGLEEEYPFYLRAISPHISVLEKSIGEYLHRRAISIMKTIKNDTQDSGDIALITSIVRRGEFEECIETLKASLQNGESVNYMPVFLR